MVTREDVVGRLKGYLYHRLGLEDLVDWAEEAMREEEFEQGHLEELRDVISHLGLALGLADVRAFGLTWRDCEEMLERLGYRVNLEISQAR